MCDAFGHPETEVSSSCVPGGRAAMSFCSGLEVSVGAVGVELGSSGVVVVGVFGAGVIGVELLARRRSPSRLSSFCGLFVSRR